MPCLNGMIEGAIFVAASRSSGQPLALAFCVKMRRSRSWLEFRPSHASDMALHKLLIAVSSPQKSDTRYERLVPSVLT